MSDVDWLSGFCAGLAREGLDAHEEAALAPARCLAL